MQCDGMADSYVFAEEHSVLLFHPVQHATILNIRVSANADRMNVAADDRVHPDAGMFSEDNVSDDLRRIVNVTGRWNRRRDAFVGANLYFGVSSFVIPNRSDISS